MTRDLALGALLRLSRLRAGLTQRELAALSGVSEREISDLERAVRLTPRAHTLAALATALHLPPATHARLVRAATVPPPLTPQRAAVAAPPPPAPTLDPAASAHAVTARLLPLIDHAVQRALAPLAETIAQQTTTLDRRAAALAALVALHAALPPPTAPLMLSDAPPPHHHTRAASQNAHQDSADHDNLREDSLDRVGIQDQDRQGTPDRRLAQQDRNRFEDAILAQYVPLPSRLSPSPRTCDPHPTPTRGEARPALCRLTPRQPSGEEDHDLSHPRRARPVLPRPRRPPRPRRQPPARPPRRPLAPRPRHPRLARLSLLMQTWARRRVQRVTLIAPNVTVADSDGEVAVGGVRTCRPG